MERIEKTVFISYRRANISWALAIFQNLTNNGYDVFFDYNGIASGDFERVILGNIDARAHFLVLLTPSSLDRCDEPNDWLRREIEYAISAQRNVVPLMLEGFDFGRIKIKNKLKGPLATLSRYNALEVHAAYFTEAMARLCGTFLNVALDGVLHPVTPLAQQTTRKQQAAARTARPIHETELTGQELLQRGLKAVNLKHDVQAVAWFRKAADAGNASGMNWMGAMYENGRGGFPKGDAQAVAWYRKAADASEAWGMHNLGVMYANGRGGLPKDVAQAIAWFRKAAELGNTSAQQALQRLENKALA